MTSEKETTDDGSGSPLCYAVLRDVEELWEQIEYRGRRADVMAVSRLVGYWSRRTAYTRSEIIVCLIDDVRNGWPIGMKKRGFV